MAAETTTAQDSPPTCPVPWDRSDPVQQELSSILRSLKHDAALMGVLSLGNDGVMRSLTADRRVVDAVGLTPAQIAAFQERMPPDFRKDDGVLMRADGTKVPREQWFLPDKSLLPAPMSQEARERFEQRSREDEEKGLGSVEARRKQMEAEGMKFA
ncbi:hypothetical protein QBC47DRAFT_370626 [Echria macrotheca]|uniref:Uncharacterized protein n=1 Tax=Echria macrotheca TaxID=438768 RepID=A0AAJ0BIZ4_9PEZI|nr:hypothetical protein QBC47DRAFT_370626 [Echria macrotheca]